MPPYSPQMGNSKLVCVELATLEGQRRQALGIFTYTWPIEQERFTSSQHSILRCVFIHEDDEIHSAVVVRRIAVMNPLDQCA